MKTINIMNFVRTMEPRNPEIEEQLYVTTKKQMELSKKYHFPTTFLLEYDALCNAEYVELLKKEADDSIELGLWYEVVEQLTSAIGMPYCSKLGYKWDWNIKPGFAMSYELHEREALIRQAMEKFKEVFGYYPKTVGSWILDTHTVNYLTENYPLSALCICRDQINTDAYTLVGGYFNQAYYPSKNNVFTPASSEETRINVPVFRLLGPDPIHNYDSWKFCSPEAALYPVYTMESVYRTGYDPDIVDWFYRTFFEQESLAFAYTQIGQENSFAQFPILEGLDMQYGKAAQLSGVQVQKMGDTGEEFKARFRTTPATAVCAMENWDTQDAQSVYYDCENYTANIFRFENKVFIRAWYLFDDRIEDYYKTEICDTFDAVYENLPLVDTVYQRGETDGGYGIVLSEEAETMSAERLAEDVLKVDFGKGFVIFTKDGMKVEGCDAHFTPYMKNTTIAAEGNALRYSYKGNTYAMLVKGGKLTEKEGTYCMHAEGKSFELLPQKAIR